MKMLLLMCTLGRGALEVRADSPASAAASGFSGSGDPGPPHQITDCEKKLSHITLKSTLRHYTFKECYRNIMHDISK